MTSDTQAQPSLQGRQPTGYPWRRHVLSAAAVLALCAVVSLVWRLEGWPHRVEVVMAVFFFAMPLLQPATRLPGPTWPRRILVALVLGALATALFVWLTHTF